MSAGTYWKALPPAARNAWRFSTSISSIVSRQSTAKPGHTTVTSSMLRLGNCAMTSIVYGLSQLPGPKRDWKLTLHCVSLSISSSASSRAVCLHLWKYGSPLCA